MATASPTGGPARRHSTAAGVGHHRGVPMEPFSAFDPYGGAAPPERLAGHLLVASPPSGRPQLLPAGDPGARPRDPRGPGCGDRPPGGVAVDELLPQWHALATPPAELFTGGPVARNALIGLVRLTVSPDVADGRPRLELAGWRLLVDDERPVGTVDLGGGPGAHRRLDRRGPAVLRLRRLGAGQLEDEIEEGSWYVVPAEARDPISADPEGLWRRVLRRQGGALALVSGFPEDPAIN